MNGVTLARANDSRTAMAVWFHELKRRWAAQQISAEDNSALSAPVHFDSEDAARAFADSLGYNLEGQFREVEVHQKQVYWSVYAVQPLGEAKADEACGPLIAARLPLPGWQYELLVALERLATWERPVTSGSAVDAAAIQSAFEFAVRFRDAERRRSKGSRTVVVVLEVVVGDHIVSREVG